MKYYELMRYGKSPAEEVIVKYVTETECPTEIKKFNPIYITEISEYDYNSGMLWLNKQNERKVI